MIIGSVAYIAPEQVTGGADRRAHRRVRGRHHAVRDAHRAAAVHRRVAARGGVRARERATCPAVSTLVGGIPPARRPAGAGGDQPGPAAAAARRGACSCRRRGRCAGIAEPAERSPARGRRRRPAASPYGGAEPVRADAARHWAARRLAHHGRRRRLRAATAARRRGTAGAGTTPARPAARTTAATARRRARHGGARAVPAAVAVQQAAGVPGGALVVACSGSCGGGWWLTSGRYTPVPAVAGLTETAAAQALRQAGFQVRTGSPVIDDNVPKGDVISTSPSGRALPGATIVLTVSAGTADDHGAAGARARSWRRRETALLRKAGLTVAAATKPVGVRQPRSSARWRAPRRPPAPRGRRTSRSTWMSSPGSRCPTWSGRTSDTIQQWAGSNHINLQQTHGDEQPAAGHHRPPSPRSRARRCSRGRRRQRLRVERAAAGALSPNLQGENFQQVQQDAAAARLHQVDGAAGLRPRTARRRGRARPGQAPPSSRSPCTTARLRDRRVSVSAAMRTQSWFWFGQPAREGGPPARDHALTRAT